MLTLICGRSRSGKTTYSDGFKDTCYILHSDFLMTWGVVKKLKETDKKDIVVEGIYALAFSRAGLLRAYKGDDKKTCIWLDTSQEVRETRKGYHKASNIKFDPPTLAEGWDEIRIIKDNDFDHAIVIQPVEGA